MQRIYRPSEMKGRLKTAFRRPFTVAGFKTASYGVYLLFLPIRCVRVTGYFRRLQRMLSLLWASKPSCCLKV
ncbi:MULTISPECIES: hypothetical protein [unclassified Neisseria]|uniref:hypothetical protein n=1 Tax=unclassified Neisseria TaxID=2623750 RepID=UPI0010718AED|nr:MULTISPECIES: hypothetical protein [unclassified Neisseria]MBF0803460.1 hypothetical protein [Neisseria sp. 19428wB4_WF04]TFU43854.1 hypothetical protein E4T99_03680 [Neisseria sp. WF04]